MEKDRLGAFSDGVIAIIITIMVLELKAPHDANWSALAAIIPAFSSYVLSFAYIAIYWNNHHHLLYMARRVNGLVLWANTHLLFWLSLIPFATAWMSENQFSAAPTTVYGVALLMPAIAYFILTKAIMSVNGSSSELALALGDDVKGKISILLYGVAIGIAVVSPWLAMIIYVFVALMWFVPDPRIERALAEDRRTRSRE